MTTKRTITRRKLIDQLKRKCGQLHPETLISSWRNSWSGEPEFAKTFINRHGNMNMEDNPLKEHLDVLEPVRNLFHQMYERAKVDGSIRMDIPEQELFTTMAITMLSVAERYAQGIVWADDHKDDHTRELIHLKEMLLMWCSGKNHI